MVGGGSDPGETEPVEAESAVAVYGDTAIVVSYREERDIIDGLPPTFLLSATYVLTRDDSGLWSQQTWPYQPELFREGGSEGACWGVSVAFDGDTAVVGLPWLEVALLSSRSSDGTWSRTVRLRAPEDDRDSGLICFGESVAVESDTVIVGADSGPSEDEYDVGTAYSFVRDQSGDWSQDQKLVASDAVRNQRFGSSVAISGDTALIGAPGSNAAYVFVRDGGGRWIQQMKLPGPVGSALGLSVSLDDNTALIGAAGSAYVYVKDASGNWTVEAVLEPSEPAPRGAEFGASVALDNGTAILGVGCVSTRGTLPSVDRAYVFRRDPLGAWPERARLLASDAEPITRYGMGCSVSIYDDTTFAGFNWDFPDREFGLYSGVAYVHDLSTLEDGVIASIDVRPESSINVVHPDYGLVPVAILSSDLLDALQVNPAATVFGPSEASVIPSPRNIVVSDVNDDGRSDLILRFPARDTGIACGDSSAELRGFTYDGTAIFGEDEIRTVLCQP